MSLKQRKSRKMSIIATALAAVFVFVTGMIPQSVSAAGARDFDSMQAALETHIFSDGKIEAAIQKELAGTAGADLPYAVFLSLDNGKTRAAVLSATGTTVRKAYDNAVTKAKQYIKDKNVSVEYLKADIVNYAQAVDSDKMNSSISEVKYGNFRYGISFDRKFETAFLEAELNANQLIDYANKKIDINKVNIYRSDAGKAASQLPKKLYLFSCRGYIADGSKCYTLGYEQDNGYGLRSRPASLTAAYAKGIIDANVKYLTSSMNSDGSFVYGRWADTGAVIPGYSILRHAGTSWELVKNYSITKDPQIRLPIAKSVEHLTKSIVHKDAQTAFVWEKDFNELKLGGNGLALLTLAEYEKTFQTGAYRELCEQLGNGILYMMDQNTGKYKHVYYYREAGKADFTLKQANRVSFYDGEATYALCVLYGLTRDQKWLDAATLAVDHFLREGRDAHKDHWTAYAMNEITKYKPEDAYYRFAMKNLEADLPAIRKKTTPAFTEMEKLMAYFETYDRMKKSGKTALADGVQEDVLIQTIFHRAGFMLNYYFYPETAMYMKNPRQAAGAVFVREDHFRTRIDDVQHFLGGYHRFYQQYERLASYQKST